MPRRADDHIRAKCFHPSGTFVEFPEENIERSIPERFEKMAELYPERLAVKSRSGHFTYDLLNKAANRLARRILACRGRGQEPVGLFLKDGARLIAAHLGVLKAGKFSLGLDPSASNARMDHLIKDSQSALVITDKENYSQARQWVDRGRKLINVDEPDSAHGEENPGLPISPYDYCYLRYTSGSTGSAKGGLKTHRHVMHAVMNATNSFHICPDDRSLLISHDRSFGKYAFDVLLNGAALCPFFIRDEALFRLADWLIQERITSYCSFPTAFRHFAGALPGGKQFPALRMIRLEGEPIFKSDVELYRKYFPSECVLINSFSSTETGPVCVYFVDKDSDMTGTRVPAGYPVEGMEVLLLDERGREVGPGETGEVAVKGRFLSSGYWRRPELTREKFFSEPQSGEDRIYTTGDLGRWSENGYLELCGRKDFQVKVRSFRVDVGEVEAVLATHPGVKEVTVIGKQDESENTRLIAYFVPRGEPAPTVSSLRKFVTERLPDYMIPALFVTLDRLPLLSTGKVDRPALPEPGKSRPEMDSPYAPPGTRREEEVAKIWGQVLWLDRIGIHDNFFDLGGDSLAATKILSQIFKQFQIEIPLRALFESPTVAAMAAAIDEHRGKELDERDLERILTELESLSHEEAQSRLNESRSPAIKK